MENLDQGYDDIRFVNIVDEDLHCAICLNVLKKPVQCQNNEHYFCNQCIRRHLQNFQTCPSCMEELTSETLKKPARYFTKHLSKLIVRCEYVERGCPEVCQLERLDTHVNNCGFAPVGCSNEGCSLVVNKSEQSRHESEECRFRKVEWADYDALRTERDKMKRELDELRTQTRVDLSELLRDSTAQCASNIKEDIIVAGGRKAADGRLRSVELFSWSTMKWEQLPSMNEIRSAASSVFYENQMIVVGGYNGHQFLNDVEKLTDVDRLDQITPQWSDFPALIQANKCFTHQSVVYKDRLFTMGGLGVLCSDVYDTINELLLVPPHSSTLKSKMLQPRCYFGAGIVGNQIVIVGGSSSGSLGGDKLRSVDVYDIPKNECKQSKPLPIAWSQMATVSWGNSLILIGGQNNVDVALNCVFMYNLKGESEWLPPMKYKRNGCSAVVSGNGIVVIGGLNNEYEFLNSVEYFSFNTRSWIELAPMIESRSFATAIAAKINNKSS